MYKPTAIVVPAKSASLARLTTAAARAKLNWIALQMQKVFPVSSLQILLAFVTATADGLATRVMFARSASIGTRIAPTAPQTSSAVSRTVIVVAT